MTLPHGREKEHAVRSMFDRIAPRYDLVNRVMTFGLDTGWRKKTVESLGLSPGDIVVDVACGTGDLCEELSRRGFRGVGVDFSWGMLAAAHTGAPLVQGDVLRLPFKDDSVHGVTCGFALRNVSDLERLFGECARVLVSGGRVALLEVAEPENRLIKLGHSVYFRRVVPLIGALLSDRIAYSYLPRSTAYLPGGDDLVAMLRRAGFVRVRRTLLFPGAAQLLTGTKP